MSKFYARVVSGSVIEIWEAPPKMTPDRAFHPDLPGEWVECSTDVAPGHVYEEGVFRAMTPAERPSPHALSFTALLGLLPMDERLRVVGAALSDPATKLWYDRLLSMQIIPLDDAGLQEGLGSLVERGIISGDRAELLLLGRDI